jgi:hypothetical protein
MGTVFCVTRFTIFAETRKQDLFFLSGYRLVAAYTGNSSMPARQFKTGRGVVECHRLLIVPTVGTVRVIISMTVYAPSACKTEV